MEDETSVAPVGNNFCLWPAWGKQGCPGVQLHVLLEAQTQMLSPKSLLLIFPPVEHKLGQETKAR